MNLLKVLFMGWLLGASLSYFKNAGIDYQLKCLLMSLSYLILAGYCYKYIVAEVKLKNRVNTLLISSLCICMIISSWFNFLFVSPDIYYLLIEAKQGDGLSWKNIYKTIELICLFAVGRNGFINFRNWLACRWGWLNVIIASNSTYNIGR